MTYPTTNDLMRAFWLMCGEVMSGDDLKLKNDALYATAIVLQNTVSPNPLINLEDIYAKNIASIFSAAKQQAAPEALPADERFDLLLYGTSRGFLETLNMRLMKMLIPSRKIALVTSVKNEGPYLVEWLAYHLAVGFEGVFIYTNDNNDGSDSLLDALFRHGFINFIRNTVGSYSPQLKAYQHAIKLSHALRDFSWAAFLDVDEFLLPSHRHDFNIKNLIEKVENDYGGLSELDALLINWFWMGSSGKIIYEKKPVIERFKYGQPNNMVKSIVNLNRVQSMGHAHVPNWPGGFNAIDGSFSLLKLKQSASVQYAADEVHVLHYFHKSFQEFLNKRYRGQGSSAGGTIGKPLECFFEWDFPDQAGTFVTIDPALKRAYDAHYNKIMSVPEIAAAHEFCTDKLVYGASLNLSDLTKAYIELKNLSLIRDRLALDAQSGRK